MSYAIKVARRAAQGDPGLFGFLGKAIGGVAKVASFVPGPIGAIAGGISAIGSKPKMTPTPASFGPVTTGGLRLPSGGAPALPGTGLVPMPVTPGGTTVYSSPAGAGTMAGPGGCKAGYRMNKSAYYVRGPMGIGGNEIKIGERCVKSRRMNPLNPKAISRAIRRLESAKRATQRLSRISIRGGCGCK